MNCRLISDLPSPGDWNMAVDQALLDSSQTTGQPVLRFYQWHPPTLSLGYFQKFVDRATHYESRSCATLRRSTGGGAILHDHELTYSLVLPPPFVPRPSTVVYEWVHHAVAQQLQMAGLSAMLHPSRDSSQPNHGLETQETTTAQIEPFLCFQRRAKGDLVVWPNASQESLSRATAATIVAEHSPPAVCSHSSGHKVMGSAQRKLGSCVLQHGSILLSKSDCAPQLLGINDFLPLPSRIEIASLQEAIARELAARFSWTFEPSEVTSQERELADHYRRSKFANDAWNLCR